MGIAAKSSVAAAALLSAIGFAAAARAQSPLADTARLQGQFQMAGTITAARHVRGEHVGETVQRAWTFAPLCAVGPCQQISLSRQRAAGSDNVVLTLTSADNYAGSGVFYAPLRCNGRVVHRGVSVPFTITVQITNAAIQGGVPVATQLSATYTNRSRQNLTKCVAVPGHDAAMYQGNSTGG